MYMPQVQDLSYSPPLPEHLYQSPPTVYSPLQGPSNPQQYRQQGYIQTDQFYPNPQQMGSYNSQLIRSLYGPPENQYHYQPPPQENIYPLQGYIGGAKLENGDSPKIQLSGQGN
jgi:hypothetical protein